MELVHPEDRERAQYHINERQTGERSTKSFELRLVARNSDIIPIEITSRDVECQLTFQIFAMGTYEKNNGHSFIGTVGVARDITERKMLYTEFHRIFDTKRKTSQLIPICSNCKNIRDNDNKWHQLEYYLFSLFDLRFTHSICPDCMQEMYKSLDIPPE